MIKRAEDMVKLYNEHMRGGDGTVGDYPLS